MALWVRKKKVLSDSITIFDLEVFARAEFLDPPTKGYPFVSYKKDINKSGCGMIFLSCQRSVLKGTQLLPTHPGLQK